MVGCFFSAHRPRDGGWAPSREIERLSSPLPSSSGRDGEENPSSSSSSFSPRGRIVAYVAKHGVSRERFREPSLFISLFSLSFRSLFSSFSLTSPFLPKNQHEISLLARYLPDQRHAAPGRLPRQRQDELSREILGSSKAGAAAGDGDGDDESIRRKAEAVDCFSFSSAPRRGPARVARSRDHRLPRLRARDALWLFE